MFILEEPAFLYETSDNQIMIMVGVIENLIVTLLTTLKDENTKPILLTYDVFEKEFVETPGEIINNIKNLMEEARKNENVIRTDVGNYIWDKVLAYTQHGYGYTPDLVEKFENAVPLETALIRDFFQPYNVKNKIMSFETAVAPLKHLK